MYRKNAISSILLFVIAMCLVERCYGYGYLPYYGGYYGGHIGVGGLCGHGYTTPHTYTHSHLSPFLKAKLLKKYLELKLKKPHYTHHRPLALPCLQHKRYFPYHSHLSKPSTCYQTSTCYKYPSCGPCPYASCNKCLKHKASIALTS